MRVINRLRVFISNAPRTMAQLFREIHTEALREQQRSQGPQRETDRRGAEGGALTLNSLMVALMRRFEGRIVVIPRGAPVSNPEIFFGALGTGRVPLDLPLTGDDHSRLGHAFQIALVEREVEAAGVTWDAFARWMSSTAARREVWDHIFDAQNRSLFQPELFGSRIRDSLVRTGAGPRMAW
jgi:hypothetical protein